MNELKDFLPAYYGVEQRGSNTYISMENLLEGYEHANYMDCKLGKITWMPYKSEAKVASQVLRNKETTTGSLGFRVTGLVVKASSGEPLEQWAKGPELRAITAENIHEKFILLASKDGELQYDVVDSFISATERLLEWFKRQTMKKFIASSLFYVNGKNMKCQMKYIDFAHVLDSEGLHDDNVIEGIENVLNTWRKVRGTTKSDQ